MKGEETQTEERKKTCSKCGVTYPLNAEYFHRESKSKSGFASACKFCLNKQHHNYYERTREQRLEYFQKYKAENREKYLASKRKDYEIHKEKRVASTKKWHDSHKEEYSAWKKKYSAEHSQEIKQRRKEYSKKNKEKIRERKKQYYQNHKEEILRKQKERHEADREKYLAQKKADYQRHRDHYLEKNRERYKNSKDDFIKYGIEYTRKRKEVDPIFKLATQLRGTINDSFRHRGYKKDTKAAVLTGMCSKDLTEYLLQTYKENYGKEWDGIEPVHIDHIIPLATASSVEDVKRLCHYTNLQLLKAKDNLMKGSKIV